MTTTTAPARVRPGMSAAIDQQVTIHHLSDRALAELAIGLRRVIEDAERWGQPDRAMVNRRALRVTVALQRVRLRLRWRYGARDILDPQNPGTDVYDHWMRLDKAPSYALAFAIDRARFGEGRSHIVAWNA